MDSFRPALSFEWRKDDVKMYLLRIVSAISLVAFVYLLGKEPENLDSLASFTNENINDLFNWGNDRFVLGQLASSSGPGGMKRKKTPQEIFMEAILDPESLEENANETASDGASSNKTGSTIPSLDDLLKEAEEEGDLIESERRETAADGESSSETKSEVTTPLLDIDTLGLEEEE